MNKPLGKLSLSLRAVACGWVACTLVLWVGLLLQPRFHTMELWESLSAVLIMAVTPGFVILLAWLVLFLPVDLIVPDQSRLRRPGVAALCGFVAGSSVLGVQWVTAIAENDTTHVVLKACLWKGLSFLLSPGITGMVAAYVRSKDPKPQMLKP